MNCIFAQDDPKLCDEGLKISYSLLDQTKFSFVDDIIA